MDFRTGKELLEICREQDMTISAVMKQRELDSGIRTEEQYACDMEQVLAIMKEAVRKQLEQPEKSLSGLIGGEAKQVFEFGNDPRSVCGTMITKAVSYSMAVLEVNASMGLIVAAPTAGSSGVLPGALLAVQEEKNLTDEEVKAGLSCAAAVGYLLMRNASVSGAEAGCQAEIGSAAAMASAAVTEMMGGTPEMCLSAAGMCLANLLGLVCDPIAGLVEIPCHSRNALGAVNAIICAQICLSGVKFGIPFDEMAEAMNRVGKSLPFELRETALGGCAATPTGCAWSCRICK